jgi:multidrug resistance efflux pump
MHDVRRMVPSEITGAEFPALYLVRSSWLVRGLARATFALLAFGSVALVFVPWQQSSRGQGRVVARDPQQRPQSVGATYDGIIKWIKDGLQEGARVQAGEVLIKLAPFAPDEVERIRNQLAQAQLKKLTADSSVENSKHNIELQQSAGTSAILAGEAEVEAARNKWKQEQANIESAKASYVPVKKEYDAARLLLPQGLRSGQDVADAFGKVQAYEQKIIETERKADEQYETLNSKIKSLDSKRQEYEVKNNEARNKLQADLSKRAEAEKEIQEIEVKLSALERLDVISPRTGLIQALQINTGADTVKKGDLLFTVVPETSELAVELTIAGNDSPLVQVGDQVRLQFQGWPAIQWVGWPSVAVGTFGGRVNSINPSDDGKGDFVVFVTPDLEDASQVKWPDNRYLRQGVRANGWVLLKTVPLGYELWRQFNGFPPIIDPPQKGESDKKADEPKKPKLPKG